MNVFSSGQSSTAEFDPQRKQMFTTIEDGNKHRLIMMLIVVINSQRISLDGSIGTCSDITIHTEIMASNFSHDDTVLDV